MASKHVIERPPAAELTLDEEKAFLDEDALFDMVNLFAEDTGIDGVIFISTNVPMPHGPRVKYYKKAGGTQQSFSLTIGVEPRVVASSLPDRVVRSMEPLVSEWVRRNRQALLSFWNEGDRWSFTELKQFIERLAKLPRS
jgi:hypothetical protein